MEQAIHCHEPSNKKTMFFEGLDAVTGTCWGAWAAIPINRGDEIFEKRNKKTAGIMELIWFLGTEDASDKQDRKKNKTGDYDYGHMRANTTFRNVQTPLPVDMFQGITSDHARYEAPLDIIRAKTRVKHS